ncbi:transmembrane protein 229B [Alligator mississippiensis]|uniref:Transmembrane protein 229B-like n=1 Tax=Alligator mississippiensis TaxID=8496 RepID=A0A151PJB9_ALLMI|nr:transmembrane protein 229B [Alligator mississippiensis]KYO48944.1 transmembrane protein 229B-like [Alligator mississippiensis]
MAVAEPAPVGTLARWYLYGLHGYACEVLAAAATGFWERRDWRLRGYSSAWAGPLYATPALALETLYPRLRGHCCLPCRCLLYALLLYAWRLAAGATLHALGACPWDPRGRQGVLELGPACVLGGLLLEKLLVEPALRLRLAPRCPQPPAPPEPVFQLKDD